MERHLNINEGQVAGLLGAAEPELRTAILLASAAGLRVVEMLELKWADVDLNRGAITITEHYQKRYKKLREIPIHPILEKQLRRWQGQEPPRETVFAPHRLQSRLRYKLKGLRGHFVCGEIRFPDLRAWCLMKVRNASIERWTFRPGHRSIDRRPSLEDMRDILLRAWQFMADW